MFADRTRSPYRCAAISPAIAAQSLRFATMRAASALLFTATRSMPGSAESSQRRHWPNDC